MYSKLLDKMIWVLEKILMLMLGAAIVIVSCQVVMRYFLRSPIWWSEQVCRCLFIWMMMLSVPILFRRKGAVAFDLLTEAFPPKIKSCVHILVKSVTLFFAACYFFYGIQLCIQTGSRIISGIEISQAFMYSSAPIAMAMLILVLLEQYVDDWKTLFQTIRGVPAK